MNRSFQTLLFVGAVFTSVSCKYQAPTNTPRVVENSMGATEDATHEFQSHDEKVKVNSSYYEIRGPDQSAVAKFVGKSTAVVWLSWHNGISMESEGGKGWDDKLTLEQLKNRLETTEDKSQASIILEKNFSGENKEDEAVAGLLKQIGFETIVVQSCHSSETVIDKIIKTSK